MFVFVSFLPLFTIDASWIVLIIRTSLVFRHLHHYVTIPLECLLSLLSHRGMPLLALSAADSHISV